MNHKVPTWAAYVISLIAIFVGYLWATFFPAAPYTVMAGSVVSLAGSYMWKRSADAKREQDCKEKADGN